VAVDSGDNAYVTGYTNSVDFPVSANAHEPGLVPGASQDSFVVKIASH
jgi:Beta-propeller repeat